MNHRFLLTILLILLLPIVAFAQTPVTRDIEDAYPPGQYRHKSQVFTVFTCPSHSCTSVVRTNQVGSEIRVIREVLPQNPNSTFRWVEIVSGSVEGYMVAEFLEPVDPATADQVPTNPPISTVSSPPVAKSAELFVTLTKGRTARYELLYATVIATVPNTASFSLTERLVTGRMTFAEAGEYRVLFRSFTIDEQGEYSSIWMVWR